MHKSIFEKLKGQKVKLVLKPKNFGLTGTIDEVFEDCIQFTTDQKTSYLGFEVIVSIEPVNEVGIQ